MKRIIILSLLLIFITGCGMTTPPSSNTFSNLTVKGNINLSENMYFNIEKEYSIPVTSLKYGPSNQPEQKIVGITPVAAFDSNLEEELFGTFHVMPSFKETNITNISFNLYWTPDNINIGNVMWCIELLYRITPGEDNLFDPTITECVLSLSAGAEGDFIKSPDIIFDNLTELFIDDEISYRLYRNGTSGSDTYTGDANAIEFTIHYFTDRLGEQ